MSDPLAPGGPSGDARGRPNPGRRLAHLPIAIVALVVIVVAAGLLTIPSLIRPAVMAPPVMPLLVTANQAGGERVAHVGYPIPITAHALGGTAIRAIEMWLGGERIGAPTQTFGRRLFVGLHAAGRPTPASRT